MDLRRYFCRTEIADGPDWGALGYITTAKECCASAECRSPRREAYQNPACWLAVDLHALGWDEGENLHIEVRHANGDPTRLPRLAAELVALRPDVLIGGSSSEAKILQAATSDIPIVFFLSSDPVGMGLVDSIAHPGRNATGIAMSPQILWGKRLELIVELIGHRPAKVAWLGNPGNSATEINLAAVMQSAEQMGIKVERLEAREAADIDRAFTAMAGSEAVLVQLDPLMDTHHQQIVELAARYQLPAIYDNRRILALTSKSTAD